MKLKKVQAEKLNEWLTLDLPFKKIQSKFKKLFKEQLFSDDKEEVVFEVTRKLKLDPYTFITKDQDEDILWQIYGINKTCQSCVKSCKQHNGSVIVFCPNKQLAK